MTCARPRRNATPSDYFPHTSYCTLHTSHLHLTLRTSSHLRSCELFSPHLSSSHLIPSPLTCHVRKFFSTVFISSEHWSTSLISSKLFLTHLSGSARQKALTVREKSLTPKKRLGADTFAHRSLRHRCIYTEKPLQNTLYHKACTKQFPVLLCTTKLAQSTSQYYSVLRSLHKALPSTTLYCKACAKHFHVLLCTTKLAQSTPQYYFVVQSLHKAATKLARSTFQYYFVLQSLHKALPSTSLYYKACTQYYFVVLQSLRKARSSTTLYYKACTQKAFTHSKFFRREAFTHSKLFKPRSFYTQQALTQRSFSPQRAFTHSKRLHTEHFTQSAFTHGKRLHTQKLLHREAFTHSKLLQEKVFTQKLSCTEWQ